MRASVAGLLAACALFGIPRLAGELREYRQERQKPAPLAISVPPESRPAANAAPLPKVPDAAALPKQAPVQLVALQRDPSALPGAGTKPATPAAPANEAELIPAIQKELARLGFYDGPITGKWNKPVRGAAREFLRKRGSRARHPEPTSELLTALKAAEPVKKQAASPPDGARAEEKPVLPSVPSVKEAPPVKETLPVKENPPKQSTAAPVPVPLAQNQDYLPPWMTAKTDHARFAAKSEAARSDVPVDARSRELHESASSFDEAPRRAFHRRRHAERPSRARRHYVSHGGYYSRRRAPFLPF